MATTRTQVYFTERQRTELDELGRREGKTLAQLVREAVDAYLLDRSHADVAEALRRTAGALPELEVPSRDEWDRGYG